MWLVANGDDVVTIALRCSLKYINITPWRSQFRNFNAIPNTALSYWPTVISNGIQICCSVWVTLERQLFTPHDMRFGTTYSNRPVKMLVPPSSCVQSSNNLQSQLSTALYWDETFRVKSLWNLRTIIKWKIILECFNWMWGIINWIVLKYKFKYCFN